MTSFTDTTNRTVFLIPGHGPQEAAMLDFAESLTFCRTHYGLLCDVVGYDVRRKYADVGEQLFRQNEVASPLLAFVSCGCFHELADLRPPLALAGYSAGQWTAMHLAGMFDFESLLRSLHGRAQLMNSSRSSQVGAMLAIIGLPLTEIEAVCQAASVNGERVVVSNINCLGQLTVAGPRAALERAATIAAGRGARKIAFANASGAWHCYLLDDIIEAFSKFVDRLEFLPSKVPVIDNVTGAFLPNEPELLRQQLVRHMNHSVRWEDGIRTLIAGGANEFIEIGYGSMLTKFGFFIDRRLHHSDFKAFRARSGTGKH